MTGLVVDHTALLALGRGNQYMSGLVSTRPRGTRHVYVPALCVAAAEAQRSGLAYHIGGLDVFDIVELDYAGAAATGHLMRLGADWQFAHAIYLGRPTADWPEGRSVVTAVLEAYVDHQVATIPLTG